MKKISIIFACLVSILAFSSCEEDTYPRLGEVKPYQEFLNTPALASQYIELTPDGTINLTCTQPDYGGMSLAVNYAVQVSLSEDFTSVAKNETDSTDAPAYIELSTKYTSASMHVLASELAEAICSLRGIQTEEGYTEEDARAVYFRLRAFVPQDEEGTTVMSNVVKYDYIKGYFALKLPGYIWLIGQPEGWDINGKPEWRLYEAADAIDSDIYYGTFEIPADQFQFRFYTEVGDWENNSIGIQVEDNPINIELKNGVYDGAAVKGKGSWQVLEWEGGLVAITVNLKAMTVEFKKVTE